MPFARICPETRPHERHSYLHQWRQPSKPNSRGHTGVDRIWTCTYVCRGVEAIAGEPVLVDFQVSSEATLPADFGDKVCSYCGREGQRRFKDMGTFWACSNESACAKRRKANDGA